MKSGCANMRQGRAGKQARRKKPQEGAVEGTSEKKKKKRHLKEKGLMI